MMVTIEWLYDLRIFLARTTSLTSYCHDSKQQMETKLLYAINADAGFDLSWYRMCILVWSHTLICHLENASWSAKYTTLSTTDSACADNVLGKANCGLEGKSINIVKALESISMYISSFYSQPVPVLYCKTFCRSCVSSRYRYAFISWFRLFTCVQ